VLVNQLGVTPSPIAPARAAGTEFAFPIKNPFSNAVRTGSSATAGASR
jgi:hypothetical protein